MTKNKKIGFIARGLTKGGVTRFILTILKEFDKKNNLDFFIFTDDESLKKEFVNLKVIYIKSSNKIFWDYFHSFLVLRKYKLDIVFYTKNIIPITHLSLPFKKINFIYDLAYFKKDLNAYKYWDTLYMKSLMKLSCKISNKIISISESTKKDLVEILGINPKKIEVVYLAAEECFKEKKVAKFSQKKPFLFYSGSVSPRKNLLRVVKAFDKIKNKINHNFCITGRDFWNSKDLIDFINKDEELKKRIKFLGFLQEKELIDFYNKADLYLYPSLYEGFGLPILEAQACGCPVLTSNATSCPEVAGDSAHIVNPYSVEEISEGIMKILNNEDYKNKLIKKGKENIKRFSWDKTANKILKLIEKL